MVSAEQAKNSVHAFLARTGRDAGFARERIHDLLGVADTDESPNVGPMWTFKSTFGVFWVAKSTGEVVFYAAPEAQHNGSPRIAQQAADSAALHFIRAVYAGYDERNFHEVRQEAADDTYDFDFEESARPPEVSIFPNFITVAVDAISGRISRYACSNLPFRRMTPPRITEAEARRIFERLIAAEHGAIERIRLHEEPVDSATRSITLWSAWVTYQTGGETSADRLSINADTGERVELP